MHFLPRAVLQRVADAAKVTEHARVEGHRVAVGAIAAFGVKIEGRTVFSVGDQICAVKPDVGTVIAGAGCIRHRADTVNHDGMVAVFGEQSVDCRVQGGEDWTPTPTLVATTSVTSVLDAVDHLDAAVGVRDLEVLHLCIDEAAHADERRVVGRTVAVDRAVLQGELAF